MAGIPESSRGIPNFDGLPVVAPAKHCPTVDAMDARQNHRSRKSHEDVHSAVKSTYIESQRIGLKW
jgi:hypothetical protein